MSQKNIVYVTKIIGLPLVSGFMFLWPASLYIQMLTLGSRRSDRLVLSLAIFIFMMKFEFSCQSFELISRIVQPVCLNNSEEDAAFLYPTNCRYFLLILLFIFLDEASTLTFSAAKLVQATFLQVPGALFSEFFQKLFRLLLIQKTFPAQGWNNSIIPCFLCFPC